MAFSVNTNAPALQALQNLTITDRALGKVQTQINTGLKVASSKDNAAVFSIAQSLRADVSGLNAVKSSLDRAMSTIDVAVAAGEAVSDLLIEMKEKAVAAKDAGLDSASRTALNDEFTELRDQITSIVDNAEFNGTNAVDGSAAIVAITNDDGSNTISIAAQNLALSGGTVTLTSTTAIDSAGAASSAVALIDASITNVNSSLSELGAGAKRLELQQSFANKLSDTIEIGIGNLVDADMAKASAQLQALQVKQQLGLQALSIANQAPQAAVSLFQ